jgi:DMSO/TMAO reductase YedYZ molybdopterin-dependent catalytic subunit
MTEMPPPQEPVIDEEEVRRLREIEIAENDAAVQRELKRLSRRGFITLGTGAVATYGLWKWLRSRPKEAGIEWPLRRALSTNEGLAESYFSTARLNRTYPPSAVMRVPRINGGEGLTPNYDTSAWRLGVIGGEKPATLTLDDLKQLPKRTMITEFRCIEGWSMIVKWGGVRLADLMSEIPPPNRDGSRGNLRLPKRLVRYVGMETPGRGYYVGLDMQSAIHPQTLLAYELNDRPLTWQHGAPVRLAIPVKYGVKNIKRVSTIRYTDVRPADFWAERGYDWYLGL